MKVQTLASGALLSLIGCMSAPKPPPRIPAVEYSQRMKQAPTQPGIRSIPSGVTAARLASTSAAMAQEPLNTNEPRARFASEQQEVGFQEYRSTQPNERDYNGPLALGDPGLTASLWRDSNGGNEMFRDSRAFAPMDLITIVVTEKTTAEGSADTEVKESSDISASIPKLLGLESTIARTNPQIDLTALLTAAATNNFKGEGTTNREGTITAKISGVVVEVMPGGLLRVEGEKIIALNSEEQNLVITGLVRTRDINSNNEVDSSKVANLRIDYFGKGTLGEAQDGGWVSRLVRRIWPF